MNGPPSQNQCTAGDRVMEKPDGLAEACALITLAWCRGRRVPHRAWNSRWRAVASPNDCKAPEHQGGQDVDVV